MKPRRARDLQKVHALPGRMRLRLPWLREAVDEATALADRLSALQGMTRVEVRPYTGSVLCLYDDSRLTADAITRAVRRQLGAAEPASRPKTVAGGKSHPGTLGKAVVEAFRGINQDILRSTDGRADLATLATLGFAFAGATEVVTTRKLPAPPWFNLAWWAFRTFAAFELEDDAAEAAASL